MITVSTKWLFPGIAIASNAQKKNTITVTTK